MAYKIDMLGGAYVVIDSETGGKASGSSEYKQRHFAEDFIFKATTSAAPVERARDDDGHFKGDDPTTPEVNEAYVGGKAPKKKAVKKKAAPAKKKAAPKKKAKK